MKHQLINFECLTPCFCAGAEQSQAEIRPTAIRGALRWWFRALGGNSEQEIAVFGGSHPTRASNIQVRVSELKKAQPTQLPKPGQMSPLAYILYYASIAGGSGANFGQGPRWQPNGFLAPKTTFRVEIRQLRRIDSENIKRLDEAILAFRHFGSIGLRITRGLGALQAADVDEKSYVETRGLLEKHGFTVREGITEHQKWEAVMEECGKWLKWLKNDLRKEFTAGGGPRNFGGKPPQATALGSIRPVRQTSAVYLRPIKLNGSLILTAFEAPHERVLGEQSRRIHNQAILTKRNFENNPPQ